MGSWSDFLAESWARYSPGSPGEPGYKKAMSKLEIWEALASIERALIQAHVQLSNASAELERLKQAVGKAEESKLGR